MTKVFSTLMTDIYSYFLVFNQNNLSCLTAPPHRPESFHKVRYAIFTSGSRSSVCEIRGKTIPVTFLASIFVQLTLRELSFQNL